jgi:bacterioferritin-associated ferredoxin
MIVCHCKGLNDRDIGKAVREGAVTSDDVASFCDAGSDCGGCRPVIEEILAKHDPSRHGADPGKAD